MEEDLLTAKIQYRPLMYQERDLKPSQSTSLFISAKNMKQVNPSTLEGGTGGYDAR